MSGDPTVMVEVREYRGDELESVQTFATPFAFVEACVSYLNAPVGDPLPEMSPDFEWLLLNARDRLPACESIPLTAVPDHLRQSLVAVAVQEAGSRLDVALTLNSQLR